VRLEYSASSFGGTSVKTVKRTVSSSSSGSGSGGLLVRPEHEHDTLRHDGLIVLL
jgi:hypothetical protein